METLNNDTFSVIAGFLTKPDGQQLSAVSKIVSEMTLANKHLFKQPLFFIKDGKFFMNVKNTCVRLPNDNLRFETYTIDGKEDYHIICIYLGGTDHNCMRMTYIMKDYENFNTLKMAYNDYLQQLKIREDEAKWLAEYKRKHPVIPLKFPSKLAPWAKCLKFW